MKRVDELYHYCLANAGRCAREYRETDKSEALSNWATEVVVHIRELNDSGLLPILQLPEA